MNFRRWIGNFFGFTRNQTNGFIFLLPLITLFIFSEPIWRWIISDRPDDFTKEQAVLDSLVVNWNEGEKEKPAGNEKFFTPLFSFDPNLASSEELQELGFSKGMANRLINYRKQGGKFRVKPDLLKLYGMDSSFYKKLEPYILLPTKLETQASIKKEKPVYAKIEPVIFDLNLADTTQLKSVRGIGSKLSARIVSFREALGGFISLSQLYEVYGLDSIVVDRLIPLSYISDNFQPRKINLNTATENELDNHPYISKRMSRSIVTYRFQHGKFESVEDLRKVIQINEKQLNQIRPYLSVD